MSDILANGSALAPSALSPLSWPNAEREHQCMAWLHSLPARHGLLPHTLRPATADASFRRYLRLDTADGRTRIVMDAPPELENSAPFVRIAQLLRNAGLNAPEVLAWDEAHGFMLLPDLGKQTLMQAAQALLNIDAQNPPFAKQSLPSNAEGAKIERLFRQATEVAVQWQLASKPGVLPEYGAAQLHSELMLFPDWYIAQHKAVQLSADQISSLQAVFERITARNLATPKVFVHCDFMPRNLMMPTEPNGATEGALGVLDFQDALYGPITYDLACLMRDAFTSWEDEFVLDVSIRYWENARKAGLIANGAWGSWADDFGEFWKAVDYMALHRHLRVAGIFARLTHRDGKARYAADAPRFIAYIRETAGRYRELKPLLRLIDAIEGMDADTAHLRRFGL